MADFIPDPTKNFTPRANPPQIPRQGIIEPPVDLENPDALRKLAKTKLVAIIQASAATPALVPAIKELMDRIDGKAPQSVAMTVKADPVSTLSHDQLAALLAQLPNHPIIIPPMPKKLDTIS